MSRQRKKVELGPAGELTSREKLWKAIRELKVFRVSELARAAHVDRGRVYVHDYLRGLIRAGIITVEALASDRRARMYTLVKDVGVDAPRVRRDGTLVPESAQQTMWRGMKILRTFSPQDLVAHAAMAGITIKPSVAAHYCEWLDRGRYLTPLHARGESPRYRFFRDTGPKAPQVLRLTALYDLNLCDVAASQTFQEALDEAEGAA